MSSVNLTINISPPAEGSSFSGETISTYQDEVSTPMSLDELDTETAVDEDDVPMPMSSEDEENLKEGSKNKNSGTKNRKIKNGE